MARKPKAHAAAAHIGLAPTPERAQHDRVSRIAEQIVDTAGNAGSPYRVESVLDRLYHRGDIDRREHAAGEEFQRLFRLAALDPLRAADMGQRLDRSTGSSHGPNGVEGARRRVNAALDALGGCGSLCGSCVVAVLGESRSIADWAFGQAWNGRSVSPHVAKGTLLGALGVLARHFGT